MNKIIKIVRSIEESKILDIKTSTATEQLLLENLTDLVIACEQSVCSEDNIEWTIHDELLGYEDEIDNKAKREKKSREITEKVMTLIKRALNAVEYPEDSNLDVCPDCGNTIDKGACFYCKMD